MFSQILVDLHTLAVGLAFQTAPRAVEHPQVRKNVHCFFGASSFFEKLFHLIILAVISCYNRFEFFWRNATLNLHQLINKDQFSVIAGSRKRAFCDFQIKAAHGDCSEIIPVRIRDSDAGHVVRRFEVFIFDEMIHRASLRNLNSVDLLAVDQINCIFRKSNNSLEIFQLLREHRFLSRFDYKHVHRREAKQIVFVGIPSCRSDARLLIQQLVRVNVKHGKQILLVDDEQLLAILRQVADVNRVADALNFDRERLVDENLENSAGFGSDEAELAADWARQHFHVAHWRAHHPLAGDSAVHVIGRNPVANADEDVLRGADDQARRFWDLEHGQVLVGIPERVFSLPDFDLLAALRDEQVFAQRDFVDDLPRADNRAFAKWVFKVRDLDGGQFHPRGVEFVVHSVNFSKRDRMTRKAAFLISRNDFLLSGDFSRRHAPDKRASARIQLC